MSKQRLAQFAKRTLSNSSSSDARNAYMVVGMAEATIVIDNDSAKLWWETMKIIGVKFGDIVILDPFADLLWVDMSPSLEQFHPHMKAPYPS